LENLPDVRALLRMGRAMVDLYCNSFACVPNRITLDIDDTFDAVHGGQQLSLFNAHYDEYGFQPIVVFDGEGRFITAVLRPAKRPGGKEIKPFLRRLLRAIRANWPNTEILLRADSHYCGPEVLDWCRANGLDYILGVAPTTTLRRHVEGLEAGAKARFEAAPRDGKVRRFKEFLDGAKSWSRVERIIARVEVGAEGSDTRFIVTNLNKGSHRALYEDVYCRRGHAETTSNPGRRIWRPIAPHARGPRPISFGCFCTPAKPPSTDKKEERENSRPGGAKPGHEPHNRRLADNPDEVRDHMPSACEQCGGSFRALPAREAKPIAASGDESAESNRCATLCNDRDATGICT